MSRILRRAFSAFPARAGPSTSSSTSSTIFPSAPSVASTSPKAVRRRRTETPPHKTVSASPLSDSDLYDLDTNKKFHFELEKDYQSLNASAIFENEDLTESEKRSLFLKGSAEWRSRVRGYAPRGKKSRHDFILGIMGGSRIEQQQQDEPSSSELEGRAAEGEEEGEVVDPSKQIVGQRIYLPNIQIRLMRNHVPEGESYDPYIATFRIPPSMTKNDLRSYLSAVYNMEVTFIRTDNYVGTVGRLRTGEIVKKGGPNQNYKRAVVGLKEPFHYPDDVEELYAQGLKNGQGDALGLARDEWLEQQYSLNISQEMRKRAMFKYYKGARWRSRTHANLGNTMREIMKRRTEREERVTEEVQRRWSAIAQEALGGKAAEGQPQAA
ncbi:mitochondrial 54S ribosomal protein uL23m [Kwoniella dejecticola CBS 10117]|uniref:Large ribosomal subunit protein uL23m n=1 Tax=Kwoniella dejecticola CBS 10117 TaxID=1296121 RepID=A0A1A6ABY4_9TREE|nr:uncharacterized protein I303_01777 [Kwoniella dejecticola CBS 10117]OBR87569.1 hypothetical protein I303_01777 [Kwoniella dejecticola CBS 10117]